MVALPFHRDGDEIVWEEEEDMGESIENNIFRAYDEGVQ
jgi:hypothetical protein